MITRSLVLSCGSLPMFAHPFRIVAISLLFQGVADVVIAGLCSQYPEISRSVSSMRLTHFALFHANILGTTKANRAAMVIIKW